MKISRGPAKSLFLNLTSRGKDVGKGFSLFCCGIQVGSELGSKNKT